MNRRPGTAIARGCITKADGIRVSGRDRRHDRLGAHCTKADPLACLGEETEASVAPVAAARGKTAVGHGHWSA